VVPRHGSPRIWGLLLVAVLAALAWTGTAAAEDPGLVDQYTEQVPTASGPKSTGGGGGGGGGAGAGATYSGAIPSSIQTQIETKGGSDAKTLEKVVASPSYGAPPPISHAPDEGLGTKSSPGTVSAAVNAVTEGSEGRMVGLFIALLVTAALMLGVAGARRSRRVGT
jgi:hypothetical protein